MTVCDNSGRSPLDASVRCGKPGACSQTSQAVPRDDKTSCPVKTSNNGDGSSSRSYYEYRPPPWPVPIQRIVLILLLAIGAMAFSTRASRW